MPTEPTPTTLRAASTGVNCDEQHLAITAQGLRVAGEETLEVAGRSGTRPRAAPRGERGAVARFTMRGPSLPSTINLANAFRVSRPLA